MIERKYEPIRPSTELASIREPITIRTADNLNLIGEIAHPEDGLVIANLLTLHPLPTHGGMMDSHIYKKAANRLPAMASIRVIRFNTRGTASEAGKSEGEFGNGDSEKFDVEAAINFVAERFSEPLWVVGWSFGTDLALKFAKDKRVVGLILLSPPLRTSTVSDLEYWANDPRPITALIPEHDDFLKPEEARERFSVIPQIKLIAVDGAKHLWVGEPSVYRVLTEIVSIVNPKALPLPTSFLPSD